MELFKRNYLLRFMSCLVTLSELWAHSPHLPVAPTSFGVTGIYGESHGGYGHIATSEAEANVAMDFLCRSQDLNQYAQAACNISGSMPSSEDEINELLRGLEQGVFRSNLQDNIARYLLFSRRAMGDNQRPMPVTLPICISGTAEEGNAQWLRNNLQSNIKGEIDEYESRVLMSDLLTDDLTEAQRRNLDYSQKINVIAQTQETNRVYQALFYYDSLIIDYRQRQCERADKRTDMACMSLNAHFEKLRSSYPMLFDLPQETPAERDRLERFREAAYAVLGTQGARETISDRRIGARLKARVDDGTVTLGIVNSTPPEEVITAIRTGESTRHRQERERQETAREARGRRLYQRQVREMSNGDVNALGDLNDKFMEGMNHLKTRCDRDELAAPSWMSMFSEEATETSDEEFSALQTSCLLSKARALPSIATAQNLVEERKAELMASNQSQLSAICNLSNQELVERYPQVVRQMVLDSSGSELASYRGALCYSGLIENFAPNPVQTCVGVSGDLDSEEGMRVRRNLYDFPFGQDLSYTIRRLDSGQLEIETSINFSAEPGISSSALETFMNNQLAAAQSYYNTQAQNQSPPLNPPLVFKVNAQRGIREPNVRVHRCWHSTRKNLKARCDDTESQQDSGNWTLDTSIGTVAHEVGHVFGLNDEYASTYYPFNNLGEHDSIMNDSNEDSRLYPRHFESIIAPALRCQVGDS